MVAWRVMVEVVVMMVRKMIVPLQELVHKLHLDHHHMISLQRVGRAKEKQFLQKRDQGLQRDHLMVFTMTTRRTAHKKVNFSSLLYLFHFK